MMWLSNDLHWLRMMSLRTGIKMLVSKLINLIHLLVAKLINLIHPVVHILFQSWHGLWLLHMVWLSHITLLVLLILGLMLLLHRVMMDLWLWLVMWFLGVLIVALLSVFGGFLIVHFSLFVPLTNLILFKIFYNFKDLTIIYLI